jgi:lysophospholipase L1-like esterase
MKGFFARLRDVWIIFGITFLILVVIELFFKIYFLFGSQEDPRLQAEYYQDKTWATEYFKEFNSCNQESWQSYVYWRRKPFTGEYININESGLRRTVYEKDPYVEVQPALKIFFFGGSTMWGSGVRDQYTIPSILGGELSKNEINAEVTNFGESGYVSTQEVIELELQLQQGNIPDVVVFYDGVNDVFSAYQQGTAGIPQNEYNRRKEFNASNSKKKSFLVFINSLKTLNTMQFITKIIQKDSVIPVSYTEKELNDLSEEVVSIYNENIKMIYALAKTYDFKAIFYWQPTIFNKLSLSEYEKRQAVSVSYLKDFTRNTNHRLEHKEIHIEELDFYDISDIFMNVTEPVFIDYCHVSEYGNTILAKRMAADLINILKAGDQETTSEEEINPQPESNEIEL